MHFILSQSSFSFQFNAILFMSMNINNIFELAVLFLQEWRVSASRLQKLSNDFHIYAMTLILGFSVMKYFRGKGNQLLMTATSQSFKSLTREPLQKPENMTKYCPLLNMLLYVEISIPHPDLSSTTTRQMILNIALCLSCFFLY